MKHNIHFLSVKSKHPPTITFDSSADAIYIYFKKGVKVSKTIERYAGPSGVATVDLDSNGEIIGIEMIGAKHVQIKSILKVAKVEAPNIEWENARLDPAGLVHA